LQFYGKAEDKPNLNGIRFAFRNRVFSVTASNGTILYRYEQDVETEGLDFEVILLPKFSTVKAPKSITNVEIKQASPQLYTDTLGNTWRVQDVVYPDLNKILPVSFGDLEPAKEYLVFDAKHYKLFGDLELLDTRPRISKGACVWKRDDEIFMMMPKHVA